MNLAVSDLLPLRLLLLAFAGFVNRDQARAIAYLVEENRVLREQVGQRRLRLSTGQRRRLAVLGRAIGRKALGQIARIATPDTILRWHRQLIAAKWTTVDRRLGRPPIMKSIRALIVKMATANSTWGYCRIQGELRKVGHRVAPSTIAKTLKDNGIAPSPRSADVLAHVLEGARRIDRRDRLSHGRSVDGARAGYAPRVVRR